MAFKLTPREIVSPKLTLKFEIELSESTLTADDAARRIQFLIDTGSAREVSMFIVFLLRETRSSMWELKNLEIV